MLEVADRFLKLVQYKIFELVQVVQVVLVVDNFLCHLHIRDAISLLHLLFPFVQIHQRTSQKISPNTK